MHPEEIALQDALADRWYIIPRRSKLREYWDYIVMTIAIYNCIWTPLTISFDWAVNQEENNDYLKAIDYVILSIYTCDIII